MNTSAVAASRFSASSAAGSLRLRTIERLLRLLLRKFAENPPRRLPPARVWSPSGGSTLITSAPWSPRIIVASGPDTFEVRSTMRYPCNGPGIEGPFGSGAGWFRVGNDSLDHLVGPGKKTVRDGEADRLGGLEIDHQLE